MKLAGFVAAACVLAAACGGVWAQEAIEPEHAKLNTEDAGTVEPGHFELELGYGFTSARRAMNDDWSRAHRPYLREEELGLGLTYGISDNFDIGFAIGYADLCDRCTHQVRGEGWTDLEIGAKWRFYCNEEARLEMAYTPAITLPTGEKETRRHLGCGGGFYSVFNGIAVSKDWNDRWTSNFDVGYNWPIGEDRHEYRGTLSADAALGCQVTSWLQPEVELNYAHDFNHGDDADMVAATVGFIMPLRDNLRLDVGVQRVLAGRNVDHATSFLLAVTLAF